MKQWEGFEHGINLGGWLSQCDHSTERYENFIHEEDFARIASWGMDHVRIPVDYDLVEDNEGNYKDSGFAYIEKSIGWCRKYGLNMILDLHKTFGYSFDHGENEAGFFERNDYQERFYSLWEQFALRFSSNEDMLAFELLNEVTDKEYCDTWNRISSLCIERIRRISPTIKILVGGYYNNSVTAIKDLLPPADENIIYNFHCYEPVIFTHQGAYWIPAMDEGFRISIESPYKEMNENSAHYVGWNMAGAGSFPGTEKLSAAYFEKLFEEAVRIAGERGTGLYCGEFGVINLVSPEDTLKWYQMICSVFDKHGIGRAAWSYKEMDFGFIDKHMETVLDQVIEVL